jgi:hypothetical protein
VVEAVAATRAVKFAASDEFNDGDRDCALRARVRNKNLHCTFVQNFSSNYLDCALDPCLDTGLEEVRLLLIVLGLKEALELGEAASPPVAAPAAVPAVPAVPAVAADSPLVTSPCATSCSVSLNTVSFVSDTCFICLPPPPPPPPTHTQ